MKFTSFIDYLNEEELNVPVGSVNTNPTDAQIKSGKYKKFKTNINGIDIHIENPIGSTRSGVDPDGTPWENEFKSHYGYIPGTIGADGDELDVFVGPNIESTGIYVINQLDFDGGFDEVKIMMGYKDKASALQGYLDNYDNGWSHYDKKIPTTTSERLKNWFMGKDSRKEFPMVDSDG